MNWFPIIIAFLFVCASFYAGGVQEQYTKALYWVLAAAITLVVEVM